LIIGPLKAGSPSAVSASAIACAGGRIPSLLVLWRVVLLAEAFLAVLVVLVPPFGEKTGRKEKAARPRLMLILLLLEFKSIYQDRNEHQADPPVIRLFGQQKLGRSEP
jgi:hypothetical protein